MADKNVTISSSKKVQKLEVSANFGKIICPSRLVIAGPTLSGKSTFAYQLVKYRDTIYSEPFSRIIYALPETSIHLHKDFIENLRSDCANIEIVEGLPDLEEVHLTADKNTHKLLILDDLMTKVFASANMLELMTSTSHHNNISVVIITQSIFLPSKHRLTLVRNCSEKVFFHNKVDQLELSIISRQIYPSKPHFLKKCFDQVYAKTKKKDLKYLLIDASPLSDVPQNAIVRSFIFPREDGKVRPIFFLPSE